MEASKICSRNIQRSPGKTQDRGCSKGPSMSFMSGPSSLVSVTQSLKVPEAAERSATTQGSSLHPKEPCTHLMASECVYHEDTAWWPVPEPICISRLPGSSLDSNWDENIVHPSPNQEPGGGQGRFSPSRVEGHIPARVEIQETVAGSTALEQLFLPTPAYLSWENKRSHTVTPQLDELQMLRPEVPLSPPREEHPDCQGLQSGRTIFMPITPLASPLPSL